MCNTHISLLVSLGGIEGRVAVMQIVGFAIGVAVVNDRAAKHRQRLSGLPVIDVLSPSRTQNVCRRTVGHGGKCHSMAVGDGISTLLDRTVVGVGYIDAIGKLSASRANDRADGYRG